MIDDTTNIRTNGNRYDVQGTPEFGQDTTITAESLTTFGDVSWDDLVALADHTIPAGGRVTQLAADSTMVSGSYECNESPTTNWGNPLNPAGMCGDFFPVIYGAGTLSISANDAGQGILLVEGSLNVSGGVTFYGPVIVRGELKTTGTGGHFNGGVIAANVSLATNTVLGNALVSYSSCAVERAILGATSLTSVKPLELRSWIDLSAVIN
jgi:hypothetical protein